MIKKNTNLKQSRTASIPRKLGVQSSACTYKDKYFEKLTNNFLPKINETVTSFKSNSNVQQQANFENFVANNYRKKQNKNCKSWPLFKLLPQTYFNKVEKRLFPKHKSECIVPTWKGNSIWKKYFISFLYRNNEVGSKLSGSSLVKEKSNFKSLLTKTSIKYGKGVDKILQRVTPLSGAFKKNLKWKKFEKSMVNYENFLKSTNRNSDYSYKYWPKVGLKKYITPNTNLLVLQNSSTNIPSDFNINFKFRNNLLVSNEKWLNFLKWRKYLELKNSNLIKFRLSTRLSNKIIAANTRNNFSKELNFMGVHNHLARCYLNLKKRTIWKKKLQVKLLKWKLLGWRLKKKRNVVSSSRGSIRVRFFPRPFKHKIALLSLHSGMSLPKSKIIIDKKLIKELDMRRIFIKQFKLRNKRKMSVTKSSKPRLIIKKRKKLSTLKILKKIKKLWPTVLDYLAKTAITKDTICIPEFYKLKFWYSKLRKTKLKFIPKSFIKKKQPLKYKNYLKFNPNTWFGLRGKAQVTLPAYQNLIPTSKLSRYVPTKTFTENLKIFNVEKRIKPLKTMGIKSIPPYKIIPTKYSVRKKSSNISLKIKPLARVNYKKIKPTILTNKFTLQQPIRINRKLFASFPTGIKSFSSVSRRGKLAVIKKPVINRKKAVLAIKFLKNKLIRTKSLKNLIKKSAGFSLKNKLANLKKRKSLKHLKNGGYLLKLYRSQSLLSRLTRKRLGLVKKIHRNTRFSWWIGGNRLLYIRGYRRKFSWLRKVKLFNSKRKSLLLQKWFTKTNFGSYMGNSSGKCKPNFIQFFKTKTSCLDYVSAMKVMDKKDKHIRRWRIWEDKWKKNQPGTVVIPSRRLKYFYRYPKQSQLLWKNWWWRNKARVKKINHKWLTKFENLRDYPGLRQNKAAPWVSFIVFSKKLYVKQQNKSYNRRILPKNRKNLKIFNRFWKLSNSTGKQVSSNRKTLFELRKIYTKLMLPLYYNIPLKRIIKNFNKMKHIKSKYFNRVDLNLLSFENRADILLYRSNLSKNIQWATHMIKNNFIYKIPTIKNNGL